MTDRNVGRREHGRPAHHNRRKIRRFAVACEALEPRELLSAAVTGGLAPGFATGAVGSGVDLTDFRLPTFAGTTVQQFDVVQLFAQRFGDSGPRPLGQTVSDANKAWSLSVGPLPDGVYLVTASVTGPAPAGKTATDKGGFPTAPVALTPTGQGPPRLLVVDTTGPRVAALGFDPSADQISVVFQDSGAGLSPASLNRASNYTLVRSDDPRGARPIKLTPSPGISGFYTGAITEILTVEGGPLPPGHYTLQVASGGITDLAGNPLDGEFTGIFPSGDGHPGGNFIAMLTVPRIRSLRVPSATKHR
jgi:hypothetical protein